MTFAKSEGGVQRKCLKLWHARTWQIRYASFGKGGIALSSSWPMPLAYAVPQLRTGRPVSRSHRPGRWSHWLISLVVRWMTLRGRKDASKSRCAPRCAWFSVRLTEQVRERGGEMRQSISTCRLVPDGGGADPVTYGGVEHVPFQG